MKRRVWQRADTIAAAAADAPSLLRTGLEGSALPNFASTTHRPAPSWAILIAPVFMTRNTITDTVPRRRNRNSRPPVVVCDAVNKSPRGYCPRLPFDLCSLTPALYS